MKTLAISLAALFALGFAGAGRAAFSGTNGKIVLQSNRDGNLEIYSMNADGTNRVDLSRNPATDIQPRVSASGGRIAFASDRSGPFDIYTMNADGSDVRQVTTTDSTDRRPAWTADGQIVFARGFFGSRTVDIVNADGAGLTQLALPVDDAAFPAPAPHGDRIAFSGIVGGTQSLYVTNSKGRAVQRVTQPAAGYSDIQANWSPRGNTLVFARTDPDGGSELYLENTDGTGLRRLTVTPDRIELEPAWSPDGTQIGFHGCSGGGDTQHCALYVMNADGSGETETSTPRAPYADTFSADRIDPFWGLPFVTGGGVSIAQINGELEISVPAEATLDPAFGYISVGVAAQCRLVGDFDVQVDYRLLTPLTPNAANLELATSTTDYSVFHGIFVFNPGAGTAVSTHFPGPVNAFAFAPQSSSSLRLQRLGTAWTASRLDDGSWVAMQTTVDGTAGDQLANLNVFSNVPPFSHPDVRIAFDNFRVSSGTFACPSWWDDGQPDWQPK